MTRGGADKEIDGPERRCVVTGESGPTAELIRFVVGPDDVIVPDVLQKLPGRGIWVSAERSVLEKAIAKNYFSRAARRQVNLPADLAAETEAVLARRVVELVSLARKAGDAVCGFEKVKDWLAQGRAMVLLQAFDGSERGKSKLWTPTGGRYFNCLSAGEIGLAFGREHAIHGALAAGGLTTRVVDEAARLAGLRGRIGGKTAGKDTKNA
ncbi:RNA-binding protein [Acidimangrovimonas sediminis]|uniref:RNA-binding protein n=1 Tax=Acidimangrovimonas sediminis TaxID=2056283 RepID=UPI000C7FE1D5|nr:RNA-binding protein [Acidimangrovimonas sediminis]